MHETNLFLLFTTRLNALGAQYMVTGSVAVIIYGEPLLTHDVDLIVVLEREHIARLLDVFPATEFYCPPGEVIAIEAARPQCGHFNIIHHGTGFKADVYLKAARRVSILRHAPYGVPPRGPSAWSRRRARTSPMRNRHVWASRRLCGDRGSRCRNGNGLVRGPEES
ncbi:MAG: hypothetical protein L0Z55_07445 [Planctomycetes bacterium]|nr:hypothetical protein [Planctomycetota bacterium]